MRTITLLALPGCLASSITLPMEMLNAAQAVYRSQHRGPGLFTLQVAAPETPTVECAGGITLLADCLISETAHSDWLLLPALWRNPLQQVQRYRELLPWLRQLATAQTLICSVGTSSCFLAEAGLLDGKPATTHWRYHDVFRQRYPRVIFKAHYLITQAERIYCAGSVNSVADLMVHLIAQHFGQETARQVEAQFSPEIRRPFASHAYTQFDTHIHQDETIIRAQEWLRSQAGQVISLTQLAGKFKLSNRTFNRRFRQATGVSPGEYLQSQRLALARELLRTTDLSVEEVALRSGFQDSSYFCRRFRQQMGMTPLRYRKSVRGKLFRVIAE